MAVTGTPTHLTDTAAVGANTVTAEYLEKRFVSRLNRSMISLPLAVKSTVPENTSNLVQWTFFQELPEGGLGTTAISATGEGGQETAKSLTTTTATATLAEYGVWTDASKAFYKTTLPATKAEMADVFGHQAGASLDAITMAVIDGSTTTVDSGTAMTAEVVRRAVQTLETNNAKPHRATPGGAFYCGIFSPEAAYDMMGEGAPVWFQVKSQDYVNSLTTPFRETPASAAIYNCIIKRSTNVQQVSSEDLNVIVADDSFGTASLATNEMRPRVIITDPEENVSAPLRNRGTMGWWAYFAAALFDNARVVVTASDVT